MIFLENTKTIKENYEKYSKIYYPVNHVKDWAVSDTFKDKTFVIKCLAPDDELYGKVCKWRKNLQWGPSVFQSLYAPEYILKLQDTGIYLQMKKIVEESRTQDICLVCYCDNTELCHLSILISVLLSLGAIVDSSIHINQYYIDLYQKYKDAFYLLVAGTRTYDNKTQFYQFLDAALKGKDNIILVSGGAKGADKLAEEYAADRNIPIRVFKADWNTDGKMAGYLRNAKMHEYIACPKIRKRGCICFWNGQSKGTAHNFKLCTDHKTPLRIINYVENNIVCK